MDEWKVIYEDCYEINRNGQVRSMDRTTTRKNGTTWFRPSTLLKTRIDKYGYEIVTLWIHGECFTKKVHRLVAEAFIENPEGKKEVNHKDGNKINNHVNNLEWNTSSENKLHAFKNNLLERSNKILTESEVGEIKFLISKGYGNSEIAHLFEVTCGAIYSIRILSSWKHVQATYTNKIPKERFDSNKKLNETKVLEIKILLKEGFSCNDISKAFKVSRCCISDISTGKSWRAVILK